MDSSSSLPLMLPICKSYPFLSSFCKKLSCVSLWSLWENGCVKDIRSLIKSPFYQDDSSSFFFLLIFFSFVLGLTQSQENDERKVASYFGKWCVFGSIEKPLLAYCFTLLLDVFQPS